MYSAKFKKYILLALGIFALLMVFLICTNKFDGHIPQNTGKHMQCHHGIAVLDGQRLKHSATCFKAHEKLSQLMSSVFSRVRDSEDKIKSEYDKIKSDTSLPQKQKLKDIAKIEAKWSDLSSKYNSEIQSIKDTDLKLTEYIQSTLNNVIESISKSLKLSIVLSKGTKDSILVFYNVKEIDVTDLVIQKMNEVLPEVNLKELSKHD